MDRHDDDQSSPPPTATGHNFVRSTAAIRAAWSVFGPWCNEARRMSEGGLVMSFSCSAATVGTTTNNNNNNNNNTNNNNNNNGVGRTAASVPRRKFSFPAVLQASYLHGLHPDACANDGTGGSPSLTVATARRRFSTVSDVVSRKLSHTIGWRTSVPADRIARQGKALCGQYMRWKLKRAGAYTRKSAAALRSARTAAAEDGTVAVVDGYYGGGGDDDDDEAAREVFAAVLRVGQQLERLDPKLYAGLALTLRLRRRPFVVRRDAVTAAVVLVSMSRELFRAGVQVTWAKVVSLLCVAAGLAVDCSRRGRAEQMTDLIEAVGEVIEDDLAAWIHYNGGWEGLQSYCKPVVISVENPVSTHIQYLVSLLVVIILFLLLLRWFDFISVFR